MLVPKHLPIIICLLQLVESFLNENICPPWLFRDNIARVTCTSERDYHCLEVYPEHVYNTTCKFPKRIREGYYPVIDATTLYIDGKDCVVDRYQPKPSLSYEIRKCVYQKSFCNEEGQVVVSNGSATGDRTCRCDYTRGYAFVSDQRADNCTCIPSKEDCTCYKKICNRSIDVLSPDYNCVDESLSRVYHCAKLSEHKNLQSESKEQSFPEVDIFSGRGTFRTVLRNNQLHVIAAAVSIISFVILLYMIAVMVVLSHRTLMETQKYTPKCCQTQLSSTSGTSNGDKDQKEYTSSISRLGSTLPDEECSFPVQESGLEGQPKHIDKFVKRKKETKKIYDAVIHCMDDDRFFAEEFKNHLLEVMAPEFEDLSVVLRSEIQPKGFRIRSLQDLFGNSRYIMIFITQNRQLSEVFRMGGEVLLIESLEDAEKSLRVIPVAYDGLEHMPFEFKALIPLKYYHYRKAKEEGKEDKIYLLGLKNLFQDGRKNYFPNL